MALRGMNAGQNAPLFANNVETVVAAKEYLTGVIVMPIADADIVGVPLDNFKQGSTTDVTIPSQIGGQWCQVVFATITTPTDALVSRIAGLKNVK